MPRSAPAYWRQRGWRAYGLLPLAGLFGALAALRGFAFRRGWLASVRLPVPVVVVGNIAVGGSGKTPVVAWAVEVLRNAGRAPGVISRGYGGKIAGCALVTPSSDPGVVGDEPVLLARLCCCPVAVGADRVAAARALLGAHPECDVLISDDGLQHYRLQRDVEIMVVDEAVLGNRWLLPSGPLREPLERLQSGDLILWHGGASPALRARCAERPVAEMDLTGNELRSLTRADSKPLTALRGQRVHALAGIGRPERFFQHLRSAGLDVIEHPFPDHHVFTPENLAFAPGEVKIMTSKDAVKCAAFADEDCWVLPVSARIDPAAARYLEERVLYGRPTA